jgi:hypothetical protein
MPVQQFEHISRPEVEGAPAGNQHQSYYTEAVGITVNRATSRKMERAGDACGANRLKSSVDKGTEEDMKSRTAREGPSVLQTVPEDIPPNYRALKLHTGLSKAESSPVVPPDGGTSWLQATGRDRRRGKAVNRVDDSLRKKNFSSS